MHNFYDKKMKKLFKTNPSGTQINVALLIARIAMGGLMLVHGLPKLEMLFSGDPIQFASVFGMSETLSLGLAVFAEVFCSLLILIGLGTRLASLPLIFTMITAVLIVHADDPFSTQEMGVHYLLMYVVLLILGSGKYSLDALLFKKQ